MKYFRKSILCILCCCLHATLTAQTAIIDSLEQILASGRSAKAEKAELLVKLSRAYLYVDTAKCRANAIEALQLAQSSGSKLAEAKAYSAIGNFYSVNYLHYMAHTYHMKAEKIYLELDDKEQLYLHYGNMMGYSYDFREYDNATYYANKVLIMAVERKDRNLELTAQYVLGDARYQDNFGQESLDYFLNLYHRALQTGDSLNVNQYLINTIAGRCARGYLRGLNRPHEALPYLYKILASYLKNDLKTYMTYIYNELADAHAMLHNIDSAEYYIDKAMDSHMIINQMYEVYFTAAKVDSLKGNYLNALANFQKFHYITDSLSKEEKTTEMARLKLWHEFDQKELENSFLQQEYQKQRKMTTIVAIALVMILALLAVAIFFYWKIAEKNREMKELHTVKDKLFSVVAHDLRSPMGALMSVLKLANRNMLDADTQAQLLKDISGRVDDTYGLIDNLLCWSKSQMQGIVPTPVYFNAQQGSRSVTDSLQDLAANKQIVLENRIEARQVYADRDMFDVVVRNLTANAIKYTSEGGEVILASELSGDMLTVSVKDTGTGMPQEIQDKLFKLSETKSQRGTGNESGTGLGLVLCADFVKANGGRIWFTSTQGEGSTFFFSVPVRN